MADSKSNCNGFEVGMGRGGKSKNPGRQSIRKRKDNGHPHGHNHSSSLDNGDVAPVAREGSTPTESISSVSLEEETLAQMPVSQPVPAPSPPVAKETEPETIVKEAPPQQKRRNMGRLEKDLGRQILTLNRSTPQLPKCFDEAEQIATQSFDRILNAVKVKRENILTEIRTLRRSAENLLHNRKVEAEDLKRRISENDALDDSDLDLLRNDLRQFVSEKECDISLGETQRLLLDSNVVDEVVKSIETLASLVPLNDPYLSRTSTVKNIPPLPVEVPIEEIAPAEVPLENVGEVHPPIHTVEIPQAQNIVLAPLQAQMPHNPQAQPIHQNIMLVEPHAPITMLNRPFAPQSAVFIHPLPVPMSHVHPRGMISPQQFDHMQQQQQQQQHQHQHAQPHPQQPPPPPQQLPQQLQQQPPQPQPQHSSHQLQQQPPQQQQQQQLPLSPPQQQLPLPIPQQRLPLPPPQQQQQQQQQQPSPAQQAPHPHSGSRVSQAPQIKVASSPPLTAESPVATATNDDYQMEHNANVSRGHMGSNHHIRYPPGGHGGNGGVNYNGGGGGNGGVPHHTGGGGGGGGAFVRRNYQGGNQRGGRGGPFRSGWCNNGQRFPPQGQPQQQPPQQVQQDSQQPQSQQPQPQQPQPQQQPPPQQSQSYNGYASQNNNNNGSGRSNNNGYYTGGQQNNGFQQDGYGNRAYGGGRSGFRRSSSTRSRNPPIASHD